MVLRVAFGPLIRPAGTFSPSGEGLIAPAHSQGRLESILPEFPHQFAPRPSHLGFTVAAACRAGSKTPRPARGNMLRFATFSRLFENFRAPHFDASYYLKRSSVNFHLVSSGVDIDATI